MREDLLKKIRRLSRNGHGEYADYNNGVLDLCESILSEEATLPRWILEIIKDNYDIIKGEL